PRARRRRQLGEQHGRLTHEGVDEQGVVHSTRHTAKSSAGSGAKVYTPRRQRGPRTLGACRTGDSVGVWLSSSALPPAAARRRARRSSVTEREAPPRGWAARARRG